MWRSDCLGSDSCLDPQPSPHCTGPEGCSCQWWVHRGFRVVGGMDREIGRRIGAAAAVARALNQSVVEKRELSRKGKISISCSVYVQSLDRDWKNQAVSAGSQNDFSPQGGRAVTCFTHLVLCSLKVVKGIRKSIFLLFSLFIIHHNTILKGSFLFEPSGQVLFFSQMQDSQLNSFWTSDSLATFTLFFQNTQRLTYQSNVMFQCSIFRTVYYISTEMWVVFLLFLNLPFL